MTFPEGWNEGRLGAICSIEIGGTPARDVAEYWDLARDTGNAWLSIKDMRRRVINETAEHISEAGVKHSNVKLQPPGTVLLSFKLTIGRVAVAGVPLYTNEAIAGLKPRGLLPEYLYHGLHHWDLLQGVDQAIKGATLNKEKLKRIVFAYPKAESEQAKIAEILSTVDQAIEQTEALIAKQQRIKTGLMQGLFTRGIDKHENLRCEQTHEFKDSPLGRIPAGWEPTQIGNAASLQRGHDITESQLQDGPYPVVSSSGVVGYHNEFTSRGPNVVVGRKGTIGRVHYIESDFWAHDTSLFVTNFFGNNPRFICYLFILYDLARFGTKSGSPSLNRNDIHPLWFGRPSPEEQGLIVKVLHKCDEFIELHVQILGKLKRLRTALMQELLTGRRRATALPQPRGASV